MAPTTTLYAWASPASGWRGADHAWVTNYPSPYPCPPAAHYWYCWGPCFQAGPGTESRLLWAGQGDLGMATCLCPPDRPDATGGIRRYGVEGISHQVANRVLYGSSPFGSPMTVQGAHMYWLGFLFFGTYGVDSRQWEAVRRRCCASRVVSRKPRGDPGEKALGQVIRATLGSSWGPRCELGLVAARQRLRERKTALDALVCSGSVSGEEFAAAVNRLAGQTIVELAEVLGAEAVRRVFEASPGEQVELLDAEVAARCDYAGRAAGAGSP